jgi:hypothetical protein
VFCGFILKHQRQRKIKTGKITYNQKTLIIPYVPKRKIFTNFLIDCRKKVCVGGWAMDFFRCMSHRKVTYNDFLVM